MLQYNLLAITLSVSVSRCFLLRAYTFVEPILITLCMYIIFFCSGNIGYFNRADMQ